METIGFIFGIMGMSLGTMGFIFGIISFSKIQKIEEKLNKFDRESLDEETKEIKIY